ncbi:leucine rich repeat protein [Holotrichia oblita]|uniref:Leucine rich repeat protein n=1 Tax=Holotrichia oblita TaxID=644536 RepID=A0ACB9TXP5_HOLOL|nr:leucine rich repeat protein [Holotrichia oblita]
MVGITEELIRKKSEHNEGIIGTLEELSLHQENVEKIENLGNWCKNLQILYLQSNLIAKIENLHKLKKLVYLNLAINNIEKIENLERCESLEKLDLTLNFIGDIESVLSLKANANLRHLYLTGNPCTDFKDYRNYVIAHLTQLETLDNQEVKRSEVITALQRLDEIEKVVRKDQRKYQDFRRLQVERLSEVDYNISDEEFWKSTSEHAPEVRIEMAKRSKKSRDSSDDDKKRKHKRVVSLFTKDGRPLNVNQAKLDFKFCDEDPKELILDIGIYKYLDTNLIDVDLQPIFVKLTVKGKVFQFVLPEEICTDKSTAQRSQTTGRLVIRMPKVKYNPLFAKKTTIQKGNDESIKRDEQQNCRQEEKSLRREYLEVQPQKTLMERMSDLCSKEKSDVPPLEFF